MTTTVPTLRRGAVVPLPDGTTARVLSTRGGFIFTDKGTYAPWQLAPPAPDPREAARTFLDTQTIAMRSWDNSALPSRREHEAALSYIAALLGLLAPETSEAAP